MKPLKRLVPPAKVTVRSQTPEEEAEFNVALGAVPSREDHYEGTVVVRCQTAEEELMFMDAFEALVETIVEMEMQNHVAQKLSGEARGANR